MEATLSTDAGTRAAGHRFHLWMAVVFVVIAFGGFVPTYWAPVASGLSNQGREAAGAASAANTSEPTVA